ncbi:hypothetical protein M422DRAFT_27266 [Sphaerobolus stellatus SS14]|nr:hypothetical protein M422DRAFT_27266 [Sphaerobolus stellatus SS14]
MGAFQTPQLFSQIFIRNNPEFDLSATISMCSDRSGILPLEIFIHLEERECQQL